MAQSCAEDAGTGGSSSGTVRVQHCASTEPPRSHPPRKAPHTKPRSTILTRAAALVPFALIVLLSDPTTTVLSPLPALASPVFTSISASRRLLQTTTNPPPPPPGPSCVGQCCSNLPPPPPGTPTMTSEWLSAQMAHGAQIQIRAVNWNTWWAQSTNPLYNGTIQCENSTKPSATTFFTVQRVTDTLVQLMQGGLYLRATPSGIYLNISTRYGTIDLTPNGSDPRTYLRIEPLAPGSAVVYIRSNFDGLVFSSSGTTLLRWTSTPGLWERWEIREIMQVPAMRGANLGSWLVYERWMSPTFYPTSDPWTVDGTEFALLSTTTNLWASAVNGSATGGVITVDATGDPSPEIARFNSWVSTSGPPAYRIRTQYLQFWELQANGTVAATNSNSSAGNSNMEFTFFVQNRSADCWVTKVLIRASNGLFLRAPAPGSADKSLIADAPGPSVSPSDPSFFDNSSAVFVFVRYTTSGSDWQAADAAGTKAAANAKFQSYWRTFYTEADWQAMQAHGINAVRVPIGYWLFGDNSSESLLPDGCVDVLDWAFAMGLKYGVRIWLSMHAVWGSQSGWSNSGSRDTFIAFGNDASSVTKQLAFLDQLGQRYGSHPMWIGIGLANEPLWEGFVGILGVPLPVLQDYYTRAYDVIRKYTPCTFIAMEGRKHLWEVHWLMFDNGHTNLVLEAHIYAVFAGIDGKTPADDIAWMRDYQSSNIANLQQYGKGLLVGEFSNAMANPDYTTDTWQQAYSLTQMQTLATAKVGWFFWAYKHNITLGYQHWSFVKSDDLGWLPRSTSGNWY